jgi:hypothetical protein
MPLRRARVHRTSELLEEVIGWLASGRTLSDFCRQEGRPTRQTIAKWVAADPSARVGAPHCCAVCRNWR